MAPKLEGTVNDGLGRREWDVTKSSRKCLHALRVAGVGQAIFDDETHNFVGAVVIFIGANVTLVANSDILALVLREVDHYFPSLGHGDVELRSCGRSGRKSCVGAATWKGILDPLAFSI